MPPQSVRRFFPALQSGFAYLDNAAGSQVPQHTIQAIAQFLSEGSSNVGQLHPASLRAIETKAQARQQTAQFLGCQPSEVVFGQSATHLTFVLAKAFSRLWGPGDEVVISQLEHEANASPWRSLEQQGVAVKVWPARWPHGHLVLDDLKPLLSPQTRLLALTATSNAIGSQPPVAEAVQLAKAVGAWSIIDTVAYSPHHLPNAHGWGADFVVFSSYKVFGPHLGFMYVRQDLVEQLPTDKLAFIPNDALIKFEPGTANHEALAGWLGSLDYLRNELGDGAAGRIGLQKAFERIEAIEQPLIEFGLEGLLQLPKVQLYGPAQPQGRTATFCFNVQGYNPKEVEAHLVKAGIGVSTGHYYAPMVMEALDLMPDGALRVSLVHYSEKTELERLFDALSQL